VTVFARVVFVLLVGATLAAFFAAQRLKGGPPVVEVTRLTKFFSPNGDGVRDVNPISVRLKEADDVTVSVVDRDGGEVRRLASAQAARPFEPVRLEWDGTRDGGGRAPDGIYRLRIGLRDQGRSVTVQRQIVLDTTPPRPIVEKVEPATAGPVPGRVSISVRRVSRREPTDVRVLRTDAGAPREVGRFQLPEGRRRGLWEASSLSPGTYLFVASVRDRAGNAGPSAPLPPRQGEVPGRAGLTVRALAAQGPLEPVRAGERVRFFVDSRRRAYRWRVRRVGAARPVKKGSATSPDLVMRAPRGISGVFLLELRNGRHSAQVPFAVQSAERAPLLVVLPAITWLGGEQLDDDGDGVPNTLATGGPVQHPRILDGLPAGFADQVAPLLVFLDRSRVRYDLTTDLALALDRARDPRPSDRRGVLLAGPLRWVPAALARRLRRYALEGGTLASFGADSLRRGVSVGRRELRRPTQPAATDPFGARLVGLRRVPERADGTPAPPLVQIDGSPASPLLTAWGGSLEGFTAFEESEPRSDDRRARLQAAIGQEVTDEQIAAAEAEGRPPPEPRPALTSSRLGKGTVIRVGLPEWVARLREDAEVAQITRNIVDLLRGVKPKPRSPLR